MNNTTLEEVFSAFLSKIRDYNYVKLSDDELLEELKMKLKSAMAKSMLKNLTINEYTDDFSRELSGLEIEALSYWLVYEWATQQTYAVEMWKYKLSASDYQGYSEANQLKVLGDMVVSSYRNASYWSSKINRADIIKNIQATL